MIEVIEERPHGFSVGDVVMCDARSGRYIGVIVERRNAVFIVRPWLFERTIMNKIEWVPVADSGEGDLYIAYPQMFRGTIAVKDGGISC